MKKKEELIRNLCEMEKYKQIDFRELFLESLETIRPSKKRLVFLALGAILALYPICLIIKSDNTLQVVRQVIEITNGIVLALFAILFTGYALFQALISRNTLKVLFMSKSKIKSKKESVSKNTFITYNLYFFIMCISYVALIVFNYLSLLGILVFNYLDVSITSFIILFIEFVFLEIYFVINLLLISEIKSFIFNLFQCFNISAISNMLEALNKYDDDLKEK